MWDAKPWVILNAGETMVTLTDEQHNIVELPTKQFESLAKMAKISGLGKEPTDVTSVRVSDSLMHASHDDLKEANRRYACIAPCLHNLPPADATVPDRTRRRWLAQYRAAQVKCGCGFIGLLPRLRECGRRERRLPDGTLSALDESIALDYETLRQTSKRVAYGLFQRRCDERGVLACSYATYLHAIGQRPKEAQTRHRKGNRAAYQLQAFHWELTSTTPRHGDRPFEIGHIDHTRLDIELVHSTTQRPLGRPWTSFLVDAFSRRVLAVYLSFSSPSTHTCLMLLRLCVRRHARLPETIVVDNAPEFRSRDFEAFLALYERNKKTRPTASPRHGSVIERVFGTTNTQFIHTLAGNTQLTRDVRWVTKTTDPKAHATWTLARLYAALLLYVHEIYDTADHQSLGQSPREAFAQGLIHAGDRPSRLIPYDDAFVIQTLASPPKGTAKVIPSRGVKIHHLYYWCDVFRNPSVERTQVDVRYDPMDVGVAYAYVGRHWVQCISEHHARLRGQSDREVHLASEELRRQLTVHGQRFSFSSRRLADFLASVDIPEALSALRLRDAELRQALQVTDGPTQHTQAQVQEEILHGAEGSTAEAPTPATIHTPEEPHERRLYKEYK